MSICSDFATRNCQLASDLTVKVGDYGISEEMFKEDYYHDHNGVAVPIRWMAPESMNYMNGKLSMRHITKEANIWLVEYITIFTIYGVYSVYFDVINRWYTKWGVNINEKRF